MNNILCTVQDDVGPLHVASLAGHTEVVDMLLEKGADPNLATMVQELVCSFCIFCEPLVPILVLI